MRWNTFGRSVLFAAVSALGLVPWVALVGPLLGAHSALAYYLVGSTVAYLGGLAPAGRRCLAVVLLSGVAGVVVVQLAGSLREVVLVLAIGVGAVRSGVLFEASVARAVVTEAVLVGGGLAFARAVGSNSLGGWAVAGWAFFLVQSVYFLVGGVRARAAHGAPRDAFEEAYGRALALLERRVV